MHRNKRSRSSDGVHSSTGISCSKLRVSIQLQSFWNKETFSDVTLSILGKTYALHKLALSQSAYFAAAFSGRWEQSADKEPFVIQLDESRHTCAIIEKTLRLLYGFEEELANFEECMDVYMTASFFQIESVMESCAEKLEEGSKEMAGAVAIYCLCEGGEASDERLVDIRAKCRHTILLNASVNVDRLVELPTNDLVDILGDDCLVLDGGEAARFALVQSVIEKIEKLEAENDTKDKGKADSPSTPSTMSVKEALYGCCRLEFLSAVQLVSLHRKLPALSHMWKEASWKQQLLQLGGETPERGYRHCFKIEVVKKNSTRVSYLSEPIEVFGASWRVMIEKAFDDTKLGLYLNYEGGPNSSLSKRVSLKFMCLVSNRWEGVQAVKTFEVFGSGWGTRNCIKYGSGVVSPLTVILSLAPESL